MAAANSSAAPLTEFPEDATLTSAGAQEQQWQELPPEASPRSFSQVLLRRMSKVQEETEWEDGGYKEKAAHLQGQALQQTQIPRTGADGEPQPEHSILQMRTRQQGKKNGGCAEVNGVIENSCICSGYNQTTRGR